MFPTAKIKQCYGVSHSLFDEGLSFNFFYGVFSSSSLAGGIKVAIIIVFTLSILVREMVAIHSLTHSLLSGEIYVGATK